MKQGDVCVGQTYEARVSGRVVRVVVLAEASRATGRVALFPYERQQRGRRRWLVRNLASGREIIMTAGRLRATVAP